MTYMKSQVIGEMTAVILNNRKNQYARMKAPVSYETSRTGTPPTITLKCGDVSIVVRMNGWQDQEIREDDVHGWLVGMASQAVQAEVAITAAHLFDQAGQVAYLRKWALRSPSDG